MSQILDRIKNIAKAEFNAEKITNFGQKFLIKDDDDLKEIIEELNNDVNSKYSEKIKEDFQKEHEKTSNENIDNELNINESMAYRILEIKPDANIEEIKSAYKTKIKEYHPDKVQNLGKEIQILAQRKTQEINAAYNFLGKVKNF